MAEGQELLVGKLMFSYRVVITPVGMLLGGMDQFCRGREKREEEKKKKKDKNFKRKEKKKRGRPLYQGNGVVRSQQAGGVCGDVGGNSPRRAVTQRASGAKVVGRAETLVAIVNVNTSGAVLAGIGVAALEVLGALVANVANRTGARVSVDKLDASAPVAARGRCAKVDLNLTVGPNEARNAGALIGVHIVSAGGSILARIGSTLVNFSLATQSGVPWRAGAGCGARHLGV
jgi:hypothetical protein